MIIIKREKDDQLSFVDLPADLVGELSAWSQLNPLTFCLLSAGE